MILDTHCHYNLHPLLGQWEKHWHDAQDHGVAGSMVVGTSVETSQVAIDLAKKNLNFFASVGIHPGECLIESSAGDAEQHYLNEVSKLDKLIQSEKVIAIGECGLDYFRLSPDPSSQLIKDLQKKILVAQFSLAKKANLPMIIHLRDKSEEAYWDFLTLYKAAQPFTQPFILHCVSGPLEFIKECVALGAYIGVAGNVTYNNSDHIRSIVSTSPKDRLLLETDAPFLPPQQYRGKICEPWMIQLTAEYLQDYLVLDSAQLIDNTVTLFPSFKSIL